MKAVKGAFEAGPSLIQAGLASSMFKICVNACVSLSCCKCHDVLATQLQSVQHKVRAKQRLGIPAGALVPLLRRLQKSK